MKIEYISYLNKYKDELGDMIKSLYIEDPEGQKISNEKISKTIEFLKLNPGNGRIILFSVENQIIGYAIIIYYWSNEYGGKILYIDELYIKQEFRDKKIGTAFIKNLINSTETDCKALFAEVMPSNSKALNFYLKTGFHIENNKKVRYTINH